MKSKEKYFLPRLVARAQNTERKPASMAYGRPRIIAVSTTLAEIQGSKDHGQLLECASDLYRCSPSAYEADE
jgi:hypothetical protein